jgi:alkylhydroperoxidase family enzyme
VVEEELAELVQLGRVDDDRITPRERLAVRYAEAMHQHPHDVGHELVGDLRGVFTDAEFVELAFAVAQFIGMGQLIHLLGVPNPDAIAGD